MTVTSAPYYDDLDDGPATTDCVWLTSADGVRIRAAYWPLAQAEGTVFILPGRTEYLEKYTRIAAGFAKRGFAALAIDWRGQGLADRVHEDPAAGHVEDFADYQLDLAEVIAHARTLDMPQPWHMLAHSMGGCIGLRAVMGQHPFRSAVFSAPMWGIKMAPGLGPIASIVASTSQKLGFSHRITPGQGRESYFTTGAFDDNLLTTDAASWDWMRDQLRRHSELSLGGPSLNWLSEALREMRTLARMPSPALPALTYLGSDEGIVSASRIRDRMARWPGGTLRDMPGKRHEVLMEADITVDPVLDEIAAHFRSAGQQIAA